MNRFKVKIPEGKSGEWAVVKFTVSENDAKMENMRAMFGNARPIQAGDYTALRRNGKTIMSDTPMEIRDHMKFINHAEGSVLINGLGIGMCLGAVLQNPEVTDVTVIELSPDVIKLVAPSYKDKRVTIINQSAFDYTPPQGKKYHSVWHDIWDDICSDNLEEMSKLHRKYGRRAEWQGSWCKYECQRYKRMEKTNRYY